VTLGDAEGGAPIEGVAGSVGEGGSSVTLFACLLIPQLGPRMVSTTIWKDKRWLKFEAMDLDKEHTSIAQ